MLAVLDILSRIAPGFEGSIPALAWQFGVPTAAAILGLLIRRRSPPARREGIAPLAIVREMAFLIIGLNVYKFARVVVEPERSPAVENALRIIRTERGLGLFVEPRLQDLVLRDDLAVRLFNANYAYGFFPVLIAALIWLYLTDRRNYSLLRTSLGISMLLALTTIALIPVAPPRLVPESGLLDTLARAGHEITFTNQYAALPSLHVGWMLLGGYCVARSFASRPGLLALLPGVLMAVTVVVTGNHFWVDGALGAIYSIGAALLLQQWSRKRVRD